MADEISNTNGGSSINDNVLVVAQTSVELTAHMEGSMLRENAMVNNHMLGIVGIIHAHESLHNRHWPPFGLPSGYTPPMGSYGPLIRFENASRAVNNQPPLHHPEFARDYQVGSTSNSPGSMAAFRQHVDESHYDLTTTILNPMMADHKTKFERLARQVERIARSVDYDEVTRIVEDVLNRVGFNVSFMNQPYFVSAFPADVQMAEVPRGVKNPKIITKFAGKVGESTSEYITRYLVKIGNLANDENLKMKLLPSYLTRMLLLGFQISGLIRLGELNVTVTDLVALKRDDGESIDDFMIPYLAERVRQVEILRKEKEKFKK
ncbi:hypothetical protein Ahy_A07g034503 [Arachis hypogaea]|uniref:Uncharacterized protein n=1 Tax=Arachis hypogaea TaxID=3818 RepID=A0A445CC12_ARAHY|nr:hypothetical protein Ahy_A07g034503 [Arachis hypogaea]